MSNRNEGVGGQKRSKVGGSKGDLLITIALSVLFVFILLEFDDPYTLGHFLVLGLYYLASIFLSVLLVSSHPRRKNILLFLIGAVVVLGASYALSGGQGYPVPASTVSTSYTCTSTTVINTTGFNMETVSDCTPNLVTVQNLGNSVVLNTLAWVPLAGCFAFSIPSWTREETSLYSDIARLLGGSVPAAGIWLYLVGLRTTDWGLLPIVHVPLNPYIAFSECDSTSALSGCVFVNRLYLLADFAFWLGLVVLASFTAGQFLKKESKRDSSRTTEKSGHPETRRALISLVPVFLVLVFGLVAVPVIISSSGIVVPNGTSFVVPSNGQYLNLPFDVGHLSRLSGDLQASRPVDVYVLNSSQFTSFVETGCLSPGPPVIENLTSGTFSTPVPAGSYNLIACLSTDTSDVSVEFTHLDLVPGMHP